MRYLISIGILLLGAELALAQQNPAFLVHYPRTLPDILSPGELVPVTVTFLPSVAGRDTVFQNDTVLVHKDAPA